MKPQGKRARLGGVLLALALGAIAVLALPALGIGKNGNGPRAAGKIASFDSETGVLTVALAKGGEISARVVRRTHIRCGEDGRRHRGRGRDGDDASASRRGGDDHRGSDGDGHELEPGDDRGGRALEPGDDGDSSLEPGEDRRRHGRHGCNRGDLVEGAVVMKAEIVLTHGSAFFKKVGLLPPQAAPDEEGEGEEEAPGEA